MFVVKRDTSNFSALYAFLLGISSYLCLSYGLWGIAVLVVLKQLSLYLVIGLMALPLMALARYLGFRLRIWGHFLVLFFVLIYQLGAWRYWRFFEDPPRQTPKHAAIVSAADGWVVYIRKVSRNEVPLAIKGKKQIALNELIAGVKKPFDGYLVGVFMTPLSVHVNRAPITGVIDKRYYRAGSSMQSMAPMAFNTIFGRKPFETGSEHVVSNERETLLFRGEFPLYLTRIADPYIDKIELWKSVGTNVKKGERIGLIKMGSQADLYFPRQVNGKRFKLLVKEGDYVYAGQTPIAHLEGGEQSN